ncbi:hypothetical protein Tco_0497292 [Tanacetum coccineum]
MLTELNVKMAKQGVSELGIESVHNRGRLNGEGFVGGVGGEERGFEVKKVIGGGWRGDEGRQRVGDGGSLGRRGERVGKRGEEVRERGEEDGEEEEGVRRWMEGGESMERGWVNGVGDGEGGRMLGDDSGDREEVEVRKELWSSRGERGHEGGGVVWRYGMEVKGKGEESEGWWEMWMIGVMKKCREARLSVGEGEAARSGDKRNGEVWIGKVGVELRGGDKVSLTGRREEEEELGGGKEWRKSEVKRRREVREGCIEEVEGGGLGCKESVWRWQVSRGELDAGEWYGDKWEEEERRRCTVNVRVGESSGGERCGNRVRLVEVEGGEVWVVDERSGVGVWRVKRYGVEVERRVSSDNRNGEVVLMVNGICGEVEVVEVMR